MDTKTWLKQCEKWTDKDYELFEIGRASGTDINPETNKPYTMREVKKLVDSLP